MTPGQGLSPAPGHGLGLSPAPGQGLGLSPGRALVPGRAPGPPASSPSFSSLQLAMKERERESQKQALLMPSSNSGGSHYDTDEAAALSFAGDRPPSPVCLSQS